MLFQIGKDDLSNPQAIADQFNQLASLPLDEQDDAILALINWCQSLIYERNMDNGHVPFQS